MKETNYNINNSFNNTPQKYMKPLGSFCESVVSEAWQSVLNEADINRVTITSAPKAERNMLMLDIK